MKSVLYCLGSLNIPVHNDLIELHKKCLSLTIINLYYAMARVSKFSRKQSFSVKSSNVHLLFILNRGWLYCEI